MRESYNDLINGNKEWVAQQLEKDPDLFKRLSAGQSPQVLWIGCSDSRVPANVITGSDPGKCTSPPSSKRAFILTHLRLTRTAHRLHLCAQKHCQHGRAH